jgi:poly(A)-specific ribonuclease
MWKDTQYDTAETRYMTKRESARNFSVTQFGVSTFTFDESSNVFETTAYTFQVFPSGKRQEKSCGVFSVQATSMEFLSKNGFDFNKWVKKGIPYLRPAEQEKMTEMLLNKRQKRSEDKLAVEIEITDTRDLSFVNAAKVQVESWIASADVRHSTSSSSNGSSRIGKEETHMTLEPCNSYLRRILRQELPKHFTNLTVTVCDEDNQDMIDRGSRWRRVRVVRYDSKDTMSLAKEREEALKLEKDQEEIRRAVGFRFVIDALRAKPAHVPLIVHNGLLDLLHTIEKFVSPLPDSFVEASRTIHRCFGMCVCVLYSPTIKLTKPLISNTSTQERFLTRNFYSIPDVKFVVRYHLDVPD